MANLLPYNKKQFRRSMGKFYVAITVNCLRYKLCKEDVKRIFTFKRRNRPALPSFDGEEKEHEDVNTSCDESNMEF